MALIIDITVRPQSGRIGCRVDSNNIIRCDLKSRPEQGKANQELIAFIARSLKIPTKSVKITLGKSSRKKRLRIDADISRESLLLLLGIEQQVSFIKT